LFLLSEALPFEFDAVGVVDKTIEDGVGDGWIADDFVPAIDGQLAGDDDRTGLVSVLDDFEQIAALICFERLGSPIVENEQVETGDRAQHIGVTTVAAGEREGGEETWQAMISDREIVAAGSVAESAGEPALADAARPGDQEIVTRPDPVAGGELEKKGPVETAHGAVVDVFDTGGMAQLGGAGSGFEALLLAQRFFLFEEQRQPFGVFETARFGLAGEVLEALGHAVKAEAMQQIEGWMGQHAGCSFNGSNRGRAGWDDR
jgi:hypothetical protein